MLLRDSIVWLLNLKQRPLLRSEMFNTYRINTRIVLALFLEKVIYGCIIFLINIIVTFECCIPRSAKQ